MRDSLPADSLREISGTILDRLLKTEEYKNSASVFTYINANSEIITTALAKKALADGKTVAAPVMGEKPHEMFFVKITSLSELVPNKYRIPEPPLIKSNIIKADEHTLVIVPGLVFGRNKYRIGYGGGYYDKFISENTSLANIGLAMDFQVINSVSSDSFDKPLDKIITQSEAF